MGRIRDYVMGVLADVMAEVRHDPFGTMTLAQAVELMSGDMEQITVGEAERIYALADLINKVQGQATGLRPAQATPPEGAQPVTDPDELRKLAEQYGVPVGQFAAYKMPVEPEYIDTVRGPVKSSEIPRDEDGNMDPAWVDANCNCPEHRAKRAAKREGSGGYI